MEGQNLEGIVLGIGVNLNSNQKDIDSIPDKIAASLNLETGKSINLNVFFKRTFNRIFCTL